MVGLDEKRLVLQHVFQEVFGGIDYSSNLFSFQMCQNLFVGVRRHRTGNAASQHNGVPVPQLVQFPEQFRDCFCPDDRSLPVQFRFFSGLDLDIDAGKALLQMHKIGGNALCLHPLFNCRTGKSCHKAQCTGFQPQFFQHH